MNRVIVIDVEMFDNSKVERLLTKLTNKFGDDVTIYNEYEDKELIASALNMYKSAEWSEIVERILNRYINK